MAHAEAIGELRALLGDRVSTNDTVREHHSHDESFHLPVMPDAVVFAESTDDVVTVVRVCNAHRVPLVPFGAGTSLEANSNPIHGGISLDMSRMDKVLRISGEDLDVTVQPGVRRKQLNEVLSGHGMFFPVDPGADATIGGMASTGASGTTTVKYGAMKQLVMALQVVTPTGEIITTSRRARKTSAGYDLTHLFVGAEGTLGIITELTLRVFGIPEVTSAVTVQFPSVRDAVDSVIEVIQYGIDVARIELLDADAVSAVNKYSGTDLPVQTLLLLEFHGTAESTSHSMDAVRSVFDRHGASGFVRTTDEGERRRLWQARHDASIACRMLVPNSKSFATDVCVPISRLTECIEETQRDLAEHGVSGPIVGHVGDGNFHVVMSVDPQDTVNVHRCEEAHARLVMRALDMGGTCTGEHGIGTGKRAYLRTELGDGAVDVMATVKRALDPNGIMNPGKVV